jgi:hypothetical protein
MKRVEFSQQEIDTIGEILASYLSELRMEIAGTDSRELRGVMKEKEVLIKGLIERIDAAREPAT